MENVQQHEEKKYKKDAANIYLLCSFYQNVGSSMLPEWYFVVSRLLCHVFARTFENALKTLPLGAIYFEDGETKM